MSEMSIGSETRANETKLLKQSRREEWALLGLASPAILTVLIVMVVPVGWLFYLSFLADDGSFSLEHYNRMLESKAYGRIFMTTFEVSFMTTGLCILIGYPLAYFLSQLSSRMAALC